VAKRELPGAYGSFADPNGVRLYGSGEAFRTLAQLVKSGSQVEVELDAPPERVVEAGPVRVLRLLAARDGPIQLTASGDTTEISGGLDARGKLAATLENLAIGSASYREQDATPVSRHVDLEYFAGHGWLDEGSMWATLILLPDAA
jgi:hypothetical protein